MAVKTTTGLAGVPVVPRSREILIRAYEKYLAALADSLEAGM